MASWYTVQRNRTIDAPPERIYPLLSDFHQWQRWSPWEDVDPDLTREYSGASSGVGAVYSWSGNRRAGSGRMEITSVEENRRVDIDLVFEKPWKSSNRTVFALRPTDGRTEVAWQMSGPRPLAMRLAGPLLNMDKLLGRDFEKGLDRLARAATG